MTFERLKRVIARGTYTRERVLEMMDAFMLSGSITPEQYTELLALLPAEEE